jgi:hypothetical protein
MGDWTHRANWGSITPPQRNGHEFIPFYARLDMTLETERKYFRGVVCLHCKAPVPVPSIVRDSQAALVQEAGASGDRSAVFNLRCPVCHKEKPYRTREIVNFEGTPGPMAPFAPPAPTGFFPLGGMTRTAKA